MKGMGQWISVNGVNLQAKAAQECMPSKGPKGPKQKRPPHDHGDWRTLSAQPTPTEPVKTRLTQGDQIEVEIVKIELHQKSGEQQAITYWEPQQCDVTVTVNGRPINRSPGDQFKIVLKAADFGHWPEAGERWLIAVQSVVGTIAFATPREHRGDSPALQKRKAEVQAKAERDQNEFLERAHGTDVQLSITLPDNPQDWEPEVWNRVDHYRGRLTRVVTGQSGTLEVTLEGMCHRRSSGDIEGGFEGRDDYLVGPKTFTLYAAKAEDREWFDYESGERGTHRVLAGVNPGSHDWDGRSWTLIIC